MGAGNCFAGSSLSNTGCRTTLNYGVGPTARPPTCSKRRLCETYVCSYPPISENIGIGVMRSLGAEVCV